MKFYRWIILALGIGLIIVSGFYPNVFKINAFTILILFILAIPAVAPYLKEAVFPGAKFIFKDEINKTKILVEKSIEKAKQEKKDTLPFETFKLSSVKELLDSDHVLALASLRIEIEKVLRNAVDYFDISVRDKRNLSKIVQAFQKKELLYPEQISALRKILDMCNKAIHGVAVSTQEAKQIIDLADELNNSFSIGYSINFFPNEEYENQGLFCEWEHCIEWMPLTEETTELSCPVWGHNCPGGIKLISSCENKNKEISSDRVLTREKFLEIMENIKKKNKVTEN